MQAEPKNTGKMLRNRNRNRNRRKPSVSNNDKDNSEITTPLYDYGPEVLINPSTNRPVVKKEDPSFLFWCEICNCQLRSDHGAIIHLTGKPHNKKKDIKDIHRASNAFTTAAESLKNGALAIGNDDRDYNRKTGQKRRCKNITYSSHSTYFGSKTQAHYAGKRHKGTLNLEESKNHRTIAGVSGSSTTSLRSDFSPLPAFREQVNKNFNPSYDSSTSAHHQRTPQPYSEIGKNRMRAAGSMTQSMSNPSGSVAAGSSYGDRNNMSFNSGRVQEYGSFDDDERRSWQSNLYPSSAVYNGFLY